MIRRRRATNHNNADDIYYTAFDNGRRVPIREENIIATDPYFAFMYARYVVKGKWKRGEKVILSSGHYASMYAREIIRGRLEEGEDSMLHGDIYCMVRYVNTLISNRRDA